MGEGFSPYPGFEGDCHCLTPLPFPLWEGGMEAVVGTRSAPLWHDCQWVWNDLSSPQWHCAPQYQVPGVHSDFSCTRTKESNTHASQRLE